MAASERDGREPRYGRAGVRDRLRSGDHLARFGGKDFVVLLPRTEAPEAQQTLTRLQRSLFFVTFSASWLRWRPSRLHAMQDAGREAGMQRFVAIEASMPCTSGRSQHEGLVVPAGHWHRGS